MADLNALAAATFGTVKQVTDEVFRQAVAAPWAPAQWADWHAANARITRHSEALARTAAAKDVTRAYFRRLNRLGLALDCGSIVPTRLDRRQPLPPLVRLAR